MSLVGWWKFEDNIKDSSGNGNDGSGTPSFVKGKLGKGLNGDGTTITVSQSDSINNAFTGDSMTLSLWWRQTDQTDSARWQDLIRYTASDGTTMRLERGYADSSSESDFWCNIGAGEDGNQLSDSEIGVPSGEWFHIVVRRDGDVFQIWINGEKHLEGSRSSDMNIDSDLRINPAYTGSEFDDLRIYDHAISVKKIKQLSKAKVLHYKLNYDGSVTDSSGQDNEGSLKGPTFTNSSPIGSGAYSFNGSGDMIPTELFYNTNSLNAITVSAWYKSSSTTDQIIISSDRSEYWRLGVGSRGLDGVVWALDSSDMTSTKSRSDLQDGNWHHIVGVFDASLNNDHKIYIDGSLDSEASIYSSGIGSGIASYTHIGVGSEASSFDGSTGPNEWMNGSLDDVRVYHTGLSASDVQKLYEQRASIDGKGNIHSHELDECFNRRGAETPIFSVNNEKLAALEDNTKVYVNGGLNTTLDAQETITINTSTGDIISTDGKPLYSCDNQTGTPLGWAGKLFGWRNDRTGPIDAYIYSPNAEATVEIYQTSNDPYTPSQTITVNEGDYSIVGTSDDDDQWIIESDKPVCVFLMPDGRDYRPLHPADNKIYGIPSSNNQITATKDNTSITRIHSQGGTSTNNLDRGETWSSGSRKPILSRQHWRIRHGTTNSR